VTIGSNHIDHKPEVIVATSPAEAVEAFGDGVGINVVAGATIVTPLITYGRLRPERALMLHAAGLNERREGDTLTIGATVTLAELAGIAPEPLASAARVPDPEIRGQGTVGGNLHVRGDLQAPLIALGARVRSAGAGGERTEPIERFLEGSDPRLVLSLEVDRPAAGAYLVQRRRHSSTYAVLSVAVARLDGGVHVAVGAATAGPAVRCPSIERALAQEASFAEAAAAVVQDVSPEDDPIASAWYRRRVLPVLVARTLGQLEEAG
jgi:CO/xanthine dehydrogenase FAD-binding subunit